MTSSLKRLTAVSATRRPKIPEPIEHGPSSSDRVARLITTNILMGRYVPGQRFIESDLARDFQVSRGTVREALKHLSAERIIALSRHRGAYVRVLTKGEAFELLEVVNLVASFAASLAATNIGKNDNRQKLKAAFERLRSDGARTDRVMHSLDHSSFYDVMFEIAGNQELIRINPTATTQILRMQVHPYLSFADLEELFADYDPLYTALAAGDGKKAKRVIEAHTRRRAAQLERLPEAAFAIE